jgi:hypothetical protein
MKILCFQNRLLGRKLTLDNVITPKEAIETIRKLDSSIKTDLWYKPAGSWEESFLFGGPLVRVRSEHPNAVDSGVRPLTENPQQTADFLDTTFIEGFKFPFVENCQTTARHRIYEGDDKKIGYIDLTWKGTVCTIGERRSREARLRYSLPNN